MKKVTLTEIAKVRVAIGLLGETRQPPWWPSAFLSSHSQAFLNPVFSRTSFLASYHGVREAAARVHDQRIGIGASVFHLFRLPEHMERELHELMSQEENVKAISAITASTDAAIAYLRQAAGEAAQPATGPVRIGSSADLDNTTLWQKAARHYLHAFDRGGLVFPFISEDS